MKPTPEKLLKSATPFISNTTPSAPSRPTSPGLGQHPLGKRCIYFHNVPHPAEMGAVEIQAFLTHLAVEGNVTASTQNP